MTQRVVTRFAPSPTGLLHGGNYRTAVFAYLYAKKTGGEFIVRIEDTDRERSKKEYEDNILETLQWLGLKHDKFYRQSENAPRHQALLKELIAKDLAYVSKEEPKEPGQRAEVIRFRNPKTTLTFTDVIRGPITVDTTDLGDFVIARSETEPVFHFAVVVDDADEGVTHVVRGEDHISNTPRQILIMQALGLPIPTYAHLPLVLGPDRTKLSKRRGAKALTQYRDEGYLPEALINYLALLGWHPEGEQELFSVDELVQAFSLERIQKGSGIFDEVKLKWFNQEYLKRLSNEAFADQLKKYLDLRSPEYAGGRDIPALAPLIKDRAQTLGEAAEMLKNEFDFLDTEPAPTKELLLQGAKAEAADVSKHLEKVIETLSGMGDESFTAEAVKEAVFPYATEVGRSAALWPMRVALSGKEKSPDPFTLAGLLGREKTLARLTKALSVVK
ncbi:MAG TPA: glutamate--tRNA ligase [Candidatus Paceibacterota bacterium]|nr:glutamate--tRNA ligase [Candidatus Paceibacterota bacterium]